MSAGICLYPWTRRNCFSATRSPDPTQRWSLTAALFCHVATIRFHHIHHVTEFQVFAAFFLTAFFFGLPMGSLSFGIFQYGVLHLAQRTGTPAVRLTHAKPHRRQSQILLLSIGIAFAIIAHFFVDNVFSL